MSGISLIMTSWLATYPGYTYSVKAATIQLQFMVAEIMTTERGVAHTL